MLQRSGKFGVMAVEAYMDPKDSGVSGLVYAKGPIIRVKEKGCVVKLVAESQRKEMVEEATQLLRRYGRQDLIDKMQRYLKAQETKGREWWRNPIYQMIVSDRQVLDRVLSYCESENAHRVEVMIGSVKMQLVPMVIRYQGLDASKQVSEENPNKFLILPFQERAADPQGGVELPDGAFEQWCREIPGQI